MCINIDDWADYASEAYEEYMQQNCTCDRSDDCQCMNFSQFKNHLLESYEESLMVAYEDYEF